MWLLFDRQIKKPGKNDASCLDKRTNYDEVNLSKYCMCKMCLFL